MTSKFSNFLCSLCCKFILCVSLYLSTREDFLCLLSMHLRMHFCIAVKWIPPWRRGSTMGIHFEYSNKREASYVSQIFLTRITYAVAWMMLQKTWCRQCFFMRKYIWKLISHRQFSRKRYQNSLLSFLSLDNILEINISEHRDRGFIRCWSKSLCLSH